jgi:hypothetical protein
MHALHKIASATVSLGLWVGVTLIALQSLDFFIRRDLKLRTQEYLNNLTLRLADITYEQICDIVWKETFLKRIGQTFVIADLALWLWRAVHITRMSGWSFVRFLRHLGDGFSSFLLLAAPLGYLFLMGWIGLALRFVFEAEEEKDEVRKQTKYGCLFVGCLIVWIPLLVLLAVEVVLFKLLPPHTHFYLRVWDLLIMFSGVIAMIAVCATMILASCIAAMIFVRVARVIVNVVAEILFRVATHPKGAWDGLVVLATIALGIVKVLFLR